MTAPNELILTREQVREVDRLAMQWLHIPGVVLMENAGINATHAILAALRKENGTPIHDLRVGICCGGGNNGGDGYVIARHLHNRGIAVKIYAAREPAGLTGDAAVNCRICQAIGLEIEPVTDVGAITRAAQEWPQMHVLIDALLGTGFEGEVRQPLASMIELMNRTKSPLKVAIDVPSGLDCQTGKQSQTTIHADLTVTFVAKKAGFRTPEAQAVLGEVVVADIGTPPELIDRILAA